MSNLILVIVRHLDYMNCLHITNYGDTSASCVYELFRFSVTLPFRMLSLWTVAENAMSEL